MFRTIGGQFTPGIFCGAATTVFEDAAGVAVVAASVAVVAVVVVAAASVAVVVAASVAVVAVGFAHKTWSRPGGDGVVAGPSRKTTKQRLMSGFRVPQSSGLPFFRPAHNFPTLR